MPQNTRYDKLARMIRRDFERVQTFKGEGFLSLNDRQILVDADSEEWRAENPKFANFRPYNALTVTNTEDETVRVYLDRSESVWMDVEAGESRSLEVPMYFTYVELAEEGGSISASGVEVVVGKVVDERELRLLEMSGLLNVGD